MPIQQLRLYDLLVDILPGITAIYLLRQIFVPESLGPLGNPSTGLQGAVILIVAGFIIGRIVHYLSSKTSDKLLGKIRPVYRMDHTGFGNYACAEIRKSIPVEDRESVVDLIFSSSINPAANPYLNHPRIDSEIAEELPKIIQSEYNLNYGFFEDGRIRTFGYSKLYGQESLYQRYNMLTTFSRNMSFILWLFAIVTITQGTMAYFDVSVFGIKSPWLVNFPVPPAIPALSLIIGIIFSRELYQFSTRRNRHLIIDLYQVLNQEKSTSSQE